VFSPCIINLKVHFW